MGTGKYNVPAMAWLQVTDFMRGWLEWEFGGNVMAHNKQVVSISHLPGARSVLRQETSEDVMEPGHTGRSMSVTRRNCIEAGMALDEAATESLYGVTKESLAQYVPIECPKVCLTKHGVLRPWTWDVAFGNRQSKALQKLLRAEFWKAVGTFDREFASRRDGKPYPAKEMVEAWCVYSHTSDVYVDDIRREWQRRAKRKAMMSDT